MCKQNFTFNDTFLMFLDTSKVSNNTHFEMVKPCQLTSHISVKLRVYITYLQDTFLT